MKKISIDPNRLIPTDYPRSLMGVLCFVPLITDGDMPLPIVVVPRSDRGDGPQDYYVCSGNHRAAAAFIASREIEAVVVESREDLDEICEGRAARCGSILDLENDCCEEARSGRYLEGGWIEYLRMITDSGVVPFEEQDGINIADLELKRKSW
jgi:hypothetical protein